MTYWTILLLVFSAAHAKLYTPGLTLKGKGTLQITNFDPANKMVEVISTDRPAEGEYWLKISDLKKISNLNKPENIRLLAAIEAGKREALCKKVEVVGKKTATYNKNGKSDKPHALLKEAEKVHMNPCENWKN